MGFCEWEEEMDDEMTRQMFKEIPGWQDNLHPFKLSWRQTEKTTKTWQYSKENKLQASE
jgi:hypothetical protein